jgi:hypothetical protein
MTGPANSTDTSADAVGRLIDDMLMGEPIRGMNDLSITPRITEILLALAAERDSLQAELDFAKAIFNDIASGRGMFGISAEQDLAWVMFYAKKAFEAFYTDPKQSKVE